MNPDKSIAQVLAQTRQQLASGSRSESVDLDAQLLLAKVLQLTRAQLLTWPDRLLNSTQQQQLQHLVERRCQGEPMAYLLGEQAFWTLSLQVNDQILVPRPETELLVELALNQLDQTAPLQLLDLGTGSGAIALALAATVPNWHLLATDQSLPALTLAQHNANRLALANVQFVHSDWFDDLKAQRFAAILSNPPYIAEDDPCLAGDGVCREPRLALVSGLDGLDAIRHISQQAANFLVSGGYLWLEHGASQVSAVQALLSDNGFVDIDSQQDLAGHWRVTRGIYYHG